ncbi:MAG: hypothetical protein OXT71_06790 [Acidobacteriota bacterium]|nr:hypothetical protein [Acidobacteriota bacterium]
MVDCCFQQFRNRPVQERSGANGWQMLGWLLAVGVVAGLVLVYAGLRMGILESQYEAARLRKENTELREFNNALRVEHATLINPETIDRRASSLGLIASSNGSVRIIEGKSRLSEPGRELVVAARGRFEVSPE